MTRFQLPFIEIELAESCNLSCHGCTNYSDYVHGGWLPWDQGQNWILPWLDRVEIFTLSLIGGEPLLNPELQQWLTGLRKMMPSTHIQLVTNGILIHRNNWLLDTLRSIGNCTIEVSAHTPKNKDFLKSIDYLTKYPHWNINDNFLKYNGQTAYFIKTYRGSYENMKPYNSLPSSAFSICCQKTCPLIHNGKLYKCSSIAKLPMVLNDWGHLEDPDWQLYLSYQPLEPDCDDQLLASWIDNYGKPMKFCSMCPGIEHRAAATVNHRSHVWTKSEMKIVPLSHKKMEALRSNDQPPRRDC